MVRRALFAAAKGIRSVAGRAAQPTSILESGQLTTPQLRLLKLGLGQADAILSVFASSRPGAAHQQRD